MSYRTISPAEAAELLEQGWTYLDVRCVEEFEAGHPAGAYNVPLALLDREAGGLRPNPRFAEAVAEHFTTDCRLVLGCAAGGRSRQACELLVAVGFTALANMHGGFSGAPDAEGWQAQGLPTGTEAPPERRWETLSG